MGEDFAMGYAMGQDSNGGNGNDWFGGGGIWGLLILALLFGGLGFGGSFGGFGGFGGYGGAGAQGVVTRADINAGFAFNDLQNGVRGIERGLCDGFYNIQNSLNGIGHQISDFCCATQRAIDGVNYNLATQTNALQQTMTMNTRDIIDSQNAGTRAILDFLTQDKITTLTAENQALRFQASQTAQNQFITQVGSDIVNRLNPPAVPSYQVPNPYTGWHGYYNGYNGGGCGYGCAASM